jgi:hypothetical protein
MIFLSGSKSEWRRGVRLRQWKQDSQMVYTEKTRRSEREREEIASKEAMTPHAKENNPGTKEKSFTLMK